MIYQFRILSDEVEDFLLDIEVPYDMNLLDFHSFLRHQLGYNPCEMASLFTSDAEWEKLQEFTLIDMGHNQGDLQYALCDDCGEPIAMEKVQLCDAVVEKFDRLVYVFDEFNERQLYIELIRSLAPEAGVKYPRTVDIQGAAPKQAIDE